MHSRLTLMLLAFTVFCVSLPASAGEVSKKVPFVLDEWVELDVTDGPVTLHRIRLTELRAGAKSKIFRPGGSDHAKDVQIQLEFTNTSKDDDWEAMLRFEWVDAEGKVIDGYNDEEGLGNDSNREEQTVTLSTLKYGLERAKKIEIDIKFYRD